MKICNNFRDKTEHFVFFKKHLLERTHRRLQKRLKPNLLSKFTFSGFKNRLCYVLQLNWSKALTLHVVYTKAIRMKNFRLVNPLNSKMKNITGKTKAFRVLAVIEYMSMSCRFNNERMLLCYILRKTFIKIEIGCLLISLLRKVFQTE